MCNLVFAEDVHGACVRSEGIHRQLFNNMNCTIVAAAFSRMACARREAKKPIQCSEACCRAGIGRKTSSSSTATLGRCRVQSWLWTSSSSCCATWPRPCSRSAGSGFGPFCAARSLAPGGRDRARDRGHGAGVPTFWCREFACAAAPSGRRIRGLLQAGRADILALCFVLVGRYCGGKLKPTKCDIVLIDVARVETEKARRELEPISPESGSLRIADSGKCLGVWCGLGVGLRRWGRATRKVGAERSRAGLGMLPASCRCALRSLFTDGLDCRASCRLHAGAHAGLGRPQRHMHLPTSTCFACLGRAVDTSSSPRRGAGRRSLRRRLRLRLKHVAGFERSREIWSGHVDILKGIVESRPCGQLAEALAHDERCLGLSMAVQPHSMAGAVAQAGESMHAVARIEVNAWRRRRREERERSMQELVRPTSVDKPVVDRTRRI